MTTHNSRRRELQELARSATPPPPKVSDAGRAPASPDNSGFVDLSALAAVDPNWADKSVEELGRAVPLPLTTDAGAVSAAPVSAAPVVAADLPTDITAIAPLDGADLHPRGQRSRGPLLALGMSALLAAGGFTAWRLESGGWLARTAPAAALAPLTEGSLPVPPPEERSPPTTASPASTPTETLDSPIATPTPSVPPVAAPTVPSQPVHQPVHQAAHQAAHPAPKAAPHPPAKKPAPAGNSLDDMIRQAVKAPAK